MALVNEARWQFIAGRKLWLDRKSYRSLGAHSEELGGKHQLGQDRKKRRTQSFLSAG